ncbi:MAG: MerR family transcriptional regulator [Pararhodobacter sp.]
MKKAPEAFRTISEVAEILDTPAHVLRFWESKFYQIRPVKRAGGRRYYRPDDVALISGIKALLQDQGMTIRGVQRVLQEQGVRHVVSLAGPLPALEAGRIVEVPEDPEDLVEIAGAALSAADDIEPDYEDTAEPVEDSVILFQAGDGPELTAMPEESAEAPYAELEDAALEDAALEDAALKDAAPKDAALPLDSLFAPQDDLSESDPSDSDPAVFELSEDDPASEGLSPDNLVPEELADQDIAPQDLVDLTLTTAEEPPAGTVAEDDEDPTELLDLAPATTPDITPDHVVDLEEPAMAELSADSPESSDRALLARRLRSLPRGSLGPRRDRAELLARRIDSLLERMSEASGAGRW